MKGNRRITNADFSGSLVDTLTSTKKGSLFYFDPVTSYLYDSHGLVVYMPTPPGHGEQGLFQFNDLTEILVIIEYRNGGQSCTCSIADTAQPEGLAVSNPLNCACGLLNL